MDLRPTKPVREFRFNLTYNYHDGEVAQAQLTPEEDAEMEALLQQFTKFLKPTAPVHRLTIDVGDRAERWITTTDQKPLPGFNVISDIK